MVTAPIHGEGGSTVFVATLVFAIVSTIAFGLRVWARLLTRAWGTDDWLMFVGWALFVVQPVVTPFSRVGRHHSTDPSYAGMNLTDAEYEDGRKWHFFIGILYTINTTIVKCSISCLMLRIARQKIHRWIFQGIIYVSVVACLVRIISWLARCKRLGDNWKENPNGIDAATCASTAVLTKVSIFFSVICIVTDLVCAIVPATIVYKLKLDRRTKTYVSIMLCLGIAASVVTIIRVQYLFRYQDPHDFLFKLAPIAFYSNFEIGLGIIAACIATMRPLLRFLPCLAAETASKGSDEKPYNSYKMQRLGPSNEDRSEQQDDMESVDSQAYMLSQHSPLAKSTDKAGKEVYICRQDSMEGCEMVRDT